MTFLDTMTHTAQYPTPETDDRVLLAACQRGEVAAWEQLLRKYERLVFSVARTSGLSADDAADITQITFSYLLQSLATVNPQTLGGWLATVARRHSWRVQKRQQRESASELTDDFVDQRLMDSFFSGRSESHSLEKWELVEWLQGGLAQLNQRCQSLLVALYLDEDEPSYQAIAKALGMPAGSIGPTRARCLQQLRKVLDAENQVNQKIK